MSIGNFSKLLITLQQTNAMSRVKVRRDKMNILSAKKHIDFDQTKPVDNDIF